MSGLANGKGANSGPATGPAAAASHGPLAGVKVLELAHRLKTGEGQMVETSLMEAALQQTYWHAAIFFATGRSPGALGSSHVLAAPYQAFRTADRYINLGGANHDCAGRRPGRLTRCSCP